MSIFDSSAIISGVASGASAGSVFGAPGAAIGGLLGGLFGKKAKKKADEAQMYMKNASAIQSERETNEVNAMYNQMLREARVNRAGSLAASITSGISTSSLSTSALSSIGSQAQYNVQYLANDRRLFSIYKNYMERAGVLANEYSNMMSVIGMAPSLTKSFAKTGVSIYDGASSIASTLGEWGTAAYDSISSYFSTDEVKPDTQDIA